MFMLPWVNIWTKWKTADFSSYNPSSAPMSDRLAVKKVLGKVEVHLKPSFKVNGFLIHFFGQDTSVHVEQATEWKHYAFSSTAPPLLILKSLFITFWNASCASNLLTNSDRLSVRRNSLFIIAQPLYARLLSHFKDIRHSAKYCNFCSANIKGSVWSLEKAEENSIKPALEQGVLSRWKAVLMCELFLIYPH